MLSVYLVSFTFGGLLVFFSLVGGSEEDDIDGDGEPDVEAEVPSGAFPAASLRFWTFFLAFGGLAGAALTWLAGLGTWTTAAIAVVVGYGAGAAVTAWLRYLGRSQVTSTLERDGCIGASGTVLLPIAQGAIGRIRIHLESQVVDFDAATDEEANFAVSDSVVVYDVRDDGVVLVAALPATALESSKGTMQ